MGANKIPRKDTVPPYKSQTRGNPAPVPAQKQPQPKTKPSLAQAKPIAKSPIPSAPTVKGLHLKAPKGKEADINKRLQKKSPWFTSIKDPMSGADAKIPDETGVETGTLQVVQRVTVSTGSGDSCGIRISSPYVNKQTSTGGGVGHNFQYTSTTGATATTIVWGADRVDNGVWTAGIASPFNGVDEIVQITNAHRVVSCALYIQPEPSLADNKGEICMFTEPFAVVDSPNYDTYANNYKSALIPVNSNKAGIARWYPVARQDWSFKSFVRTDGTVPSYDDTASTNYPVWSVGFVATGCAANVIFRGTIVVNYEFIPKNNTLNILGATPSPQDAQEVDLVENWVQELPVSEPIPQRQAGKSPSAVEPQHGENDSGTGFGMAFNVLAELLPFALALL